MNFHPSRRNLLALGAAASSLAAAPAWLSEAFAQKPATASGPERLAAALARAKAAGKPLFVVLVPEKEREERGLLWADFFCFATDETLADCALCEWVCAPVAGQPSDALAVVLETDDDQAPPRAVAGTIPRLTKEEREVLMGRVEALQPRVEALSPLVRKAILPSAEFLERRAKRCLGIQRSAIALPEIEHAHFMRPRLEAVDAFAAYVHFFTAEHPQRARWIGFLAQAAALRLWEKDIDGANWAAAPFDPCPPCGMGRVGPSPRRFLDFYTGGAK